MNIKVLNEKDFEIRPFKNNISSNHSLINSTDKSQSLLKSLQSIGMLDNDFMIQSNTSYLNSETAELKKYPLNLTNHAPIEKSSKFDLLVNFNLPFDSEIMTCKFDPKNKFVACGLLNGYLGVVDIKNANLKYFIQKTNKNYSIVALRWKNESFSDIITVANSEGSLTSYNLNESKLRYKIKKKNVQFLALDYNFDGNHIVVGDSGGNLELYDEFTEKSVVLYRKASNFSKGHSNRVFSVKFFHDDHNVFASGGWDGMVFFWDIRCKKPVRFLKGPKMSGDCLDYKNGKLLATSFEKKDNFFVYDVKKMTLVSDFDNFEDSKFDKMSNYSANFIGENYEYSFCSGSSDPNCVRFYENFSKNSEKMDFQHTWTVDGFTKGVYSTDISKDSKYLAVACGDKHLSVININNYQ